MFCVCFAPVPTDYIFCFYIYENDIVVCFTVHVHVDNEEIAAKAKVTVKQEKSDTLHPLLKPPGNGDHIREWY